MELVHDRVLVKLNFENEFNFIEVDKADSRCFPFPLLSSICATAHTDTAVGERYVKSPESVQLCNFLAPFLLAFKVTAESLVRELKLCLQ